MTETTEVDVSTAAPFTAEGAGTRQEFYAELAGRGPIHRVALPGGAPAWLTTGYDEARQVMNEPRLRKAPTPNGKLLQAARPEIAPAMLSHMLQCDGADHARLRGLVGAVFTRRRIERLAPRITAIADDLLDAFGEVVEIDLLSSYAYPLPMTVICELLGVPEADRAEFHRCTAAMANAVGTDPEALFSATTAVVELSRRLVDEKRRRPADDLLSDLVSTRDGADMLTDDELTSMVWLLVAAGHETTVNLIGNAVHALLTHPDQLSRLRRQPELLGSAIEES